MTAQIKMTRKEAEVQMACFRQTFSSVRLLNEKAVLHAPQTHSKRTELECRVLHEKRQLTTLDVTPQRAEQIFARYVEVDGEPCVLELVQDLQQDTPEAVVQRRQMLTQTGSMGEKLYRDALTGLYNRRYYGGRPEEARHGSRRCCPGHGRLQGVQRNVWASGGR